jgi:tetratricopeptide (TPR) repeat protein
MAKKKKQKKAVLPQKISPEKLIQTSARKLPLGKCYMPSDFETASICSIIVTRKMGGHYVVGIYLIDRGCLGLKSTSYRFDYDEDDLEALMEDISIHEDLQEFSYVEAHNFIYGAITYAEELGFEPDSDWRISQYILEEDSEEIELIEYEYGKDGKPFYFAGPFDNTAKIVGTLNRNVGEGNYHYLLPMDGFDDDFDDDDDDFDDDEEEEYWLEEEIQELAEDIGFEEEDIDKFDFDITTDVVISETMKSLLPIDLERIDEIAMKINGTKKANSKDIEALKILIEKYPFHPQLYNALTSAYFITRQIAKAEAIIDKTVEVFPDYLYGKISYAERYFVEKDPDKAIEAAFNGHFHLSDLYPERVDFHVNEFSVFYLAIMRYHIQKGNIIKAEMYLELIETIAPDESHTKNAREIFDRSKKKGIFKFW